MARGRAAGYDHQLDAIAAQAARLFAGQGYAGTSMQQVADACALSKASLYHYVPTKQALLVVIADTHVSRLQSLVEQQVALAHDTGATAECHLRNLITQLVRAYAGAQHAHRVLTEDVRFLEAVARDRVLGKERAVVQGFAQAVAALRPDLQAADDHAHLAKPLTMLLFGMVNWMFTWMKPGGRLDHEAMAPLVADLFIGGLSALPLPASQAIVAPAHRQLAADFGDLQSLARKGSVLESTVRKSTARKSPVRKSPVRKSPAQPKETSA